MVFLLVLLFLIIIVAQVPGLVKKKMWRELAVFGVLLFLGMVYSFAQVLDVPVPNPMSGVEAVFKPLSVFLEKLLT